VNQVGQLDKDFWIIPEWAVNQTVWWNRWVIKVDHGGTIDIGDLQLAGHSHQRSLLNQS
jgi:hypothetical protein